MKSVLLIRVNAFNELANTRSAPDVVRRAFPDCRLVALATPQSEALPILQKDPRIHEILLFPPPDTEEKSLRAFKNFARQQNFTSVVVCAGTTPALYYGRHLLSALLWSGRKYLLDERLQLVPLSSLRGLGFLWKKAILPAFSRVVWNALMRLGARCWGRGDATPLTSSQKQSIRRILWIRPDHIGDLVMSLPALSALGIDFPEAQIDAVVHGGSVSVLTDQEIVNTVFSYTPPLFARTAVQSTGTLQFLSLLWHLRRRSYDLAIETRGCDIGRWIAFSVGARFRSGPRISPYGETASNCSFILTHPVSLQAGQSAHENNSQVVRSLGVAMPEAPFLLTVLPRRSATVRTKLDSLKVGRDFAVIHAVSADEMRTWRPERCAAVADYLSAAYDLDVLLSGAADDVAFNASILEHTASPTRAFNIAGEFSLPELPALFQLTRIMVTVDTGPMHIAAAVGTPLVALFLPWLAAIHHPYLQPDVLTPDEKPPPEVEAENRHQKAILDGIAVADVLQMIDRKMRQENALHRMAGE